jgi:hypothetical protein
MRKYILSEENIYYFGNNELVLIEAFYGNVRIGYTRDYSFVKPIWNGTEMIETATAEEIAEANKPIVPEVVSRRQFKIALAVLGYNENNILEGINQLPEPNKTIARISYTESGTFERYSSDLIFVATNFLDLSSEQIDEVFLTAINF